MLAFVTGLCLARAFGGGQGWAPRLLARARGPPTRLLRVGGRAPGRFHDGNDVGSCYRVRTLMIRRSVKQGFELTASMHHA
jgi:hypothetical protein